MVNKQGGKKGWGLKKKLPHTAMPRIYACKTNILTIDVAYMVEDKTLDLGLWVTLGAKCNRW